MSEDEVTGKARAFELIVDAWDKALAEGGDPDVIASVALFAALADMVDRYGVDAVAEFSGTLAERVRSGEFTLAEES